MTAVRVTTSSINTDTPMTDTPYLGLPFIEGGQAQKHVTHNEALRILDAAIQIAVRDMTRTAPPASPAEGQRHVVAAAATGAWAGQGNAIASWQDGAWAFLPAKSGWCVWSVADDLMMVFDGAAWRALGAPPLDNVTHLGINAVADGSNRLSVTSNAALFAAIAAADGGSGDVRLQLSREGAARTASVVFSDASSGRAELGLVGSDAFKLKVSPDGSSFIEAFAIDQSTGNLALPRGLTLSGVSAPTQITANQNDYTPAGLAAAAVLQVSSDAARSLSGLGGGAEGRLVAVINVGGQPITLLDDSAASLAANRFALGGNLTVAAKQSALLRYDGTAARWQALTGGAALRADQPQSLTAAQQAQARGNISAPLRGYLAGLALSNDATTPNTVIAIAAGVCADGAAAALIQLGAFSKTIGGAWTAGSGNGGLANGIVRLTNSWYHVFAGIASGIADVFIDADAGGANHPAAFTAWRRIGSILTDGTGSGNISRFVQIEDTFYWQGARSFTTSSVGTSAMLVTLPVPSGLRIRPVIRAVAPSAQGNSVIITSPWELDEAPGTSYAVTPGFDVIGSSCQVHLSASLYTDTSSRIRIRGDAGSLSLAIFVRGWIDGRGKYE
jgi:hypothetical protein